MEALKSINCVLLKRLTLILLCSLFVSVSLAGVKTVTYPRTETKASDVFTKETFEMALASRDSGKTDCRVLWLAHGFDTQHSVHKAMEFMATKVAEKFGGELQVVIYPSEQLGNEKECIEALQLGYLGVFETDLIFY